MRSSRAKAEPTRAFEGRAIVELVTQSAIAISSDNRDKCRQYEKLIILSCQKTQAPNRNQINFKLELDRTWASIQGKSHLLSSSLIDTL